MSLQKQITLILLVVITLFAGLDHAVQRFIIMPGHRQTDRRNGERQMRGGITTLEREIQHLNRLGEDWAARQDLAGGIALGRLRPEKAEHLEIELAAGHIDFCYLLDRDGVVVWSQPPAAAAYPGSDAEILNAAGLGGGQGRVTPPAGNYAGFLRTGNGILLVSLHAVGASAGAGSAKGFCLIGKVLGAELRQAIVRQSGVELEVWGCDCAPPHDHRAGACGGRGCALEAGANFSAEESAALRADGPLLPVLVREVGGDRLECFALAGDAFGRRTILLKAALPMEITAMGREVLNGALLSLVTAGLLIVIVLREAIKLSVLRPLSLLTAHALSLRSSTSHASHISRVLSSRNELGELAREFDSMVERLARARRQLVEQSYYSGMTEVAAGVMHSLRNALTPVTANLDLLREDFRDLPLEPMKMAGRELAAGEVAAERREMLARYLRESVDYLDGVMADAALRLKGINDGVAGVERILAEQEKFAGRDRRREPVNLDELVREAGALLSLNYYSGLELVIDSSLAAVGPVECRRHALLHIFTNLISNAIEAILRSGRADGRIEIRAEIVDSAQPEMVHVRVGDNGCGIASEEMVHLFERGYSTKESDSSGIGLHWCANTMAAMQGRIYAESGGSNGGVVMHLLLPRGNRQPKKVAKG